jgi:hypothetical protein
MFLTLLTTSVVTGCPVVNNKSSTIIKRDLEFKIELYNNGQLVRSWISKQSELKMFYHSNGFSFIEKDSGKWIRVLGTSVIVTEI